MRGDISKLSASVGSCIVSSEPCSVFFISNCSVTEWEEVESTLKSVLNTEKLKHVEAKFSCTQSSRSRGVSKEYLSKLWLVPENLSKKSIEINTQLRRQSKDNSLPRNHTTNDRMLRCKSLESVFFSDTMFATKHKSTRVNQHWQVFVSDKGYVVVYPMNSQDEFDTSLRWFYKEVGVTVDLIVDAFSSQKKPRVKRFCDQVGTTLKILERTIP